MKKPLPILSAVKPPARESERQTLYRINWALHKQGKHACAECLNVFEWTHDNFHWRNQSKGMLYHICKNCQPSVNRRYAASAADQKRRLLARTLKKTA